MKRIILTALAAAALLSSCNRDEIVETNPQNAISFDNAFVDHATRATEITKDNLTEFYVHGVRNDGKNVMTVFDNTRVYREESAPENYTYKYDDTRYWFDGNYEFMACNVSSANAGRPKVTLEPGDDGLLSSGRLKYTIDPETDLIMARADRTVSENATVGTGKVELTFNHLMSEIAFEITNSLGNAYDLVFNNDGTNNATMILVRCPGDGSYNFAQAAWDSNFNSTWQTLEMVPSVTTIPGNPGNPGDADNVFRTDGKFIYPSAKNTTEYMMHAWIKIAIVQHGGTVPDYVLEKNEFNYYNSQGIPLGIKLEPGKKYLIKINVTPESINAKEIEFDVTEVNSFTDGGSVTVPMK